MRHTTDGREDCASPRRGREEYVSILLLYHDRAPHTAISAGDPVYEQHRVNNTLNALPYRWREWPPANASREVLSLE